jgi:hypothetical protein
VTRPNHVPTQAWLLPRDFVLISDFENQTGDPAFDKSLTTAFTTSLASLIHQN